MSVKDIIVKPIKSSVANEFVKKHHYSGKVVPNSQLHFGCFLNGILGGVMSFGPSLDKKKVMGLVKDTKFNDFLELNRMAFSDLLPRNSESRCISVSIRLIKKHYPNIKWIISFADACQCGDDTIYRASGFLLTQIKQNDSIRINPENGTLMQRMQAFHLKICDKWNKWEKLKGNMLRYIYFIDKSKEKDLTVPVLPYSAIQEKGAGMYLGKKRDLCVGLRENTNQCTNGGAIPTPTLHLEGV